MYTSNKLLQTKCIERHTTELVSSFFITVLIWGIEVEFSVALN